MRRIRNQRRPRSPKAPGAVPAIPPVPDELRPAIRALVGSAALFRSAFLACARGADPAQILRERAMFLELGSEVLDGWADCMRVPNDP